MSLKIIDKNIKQIVTNATKLNMLIHSTAMLVIEHAKEHGDCTRALTLVNAMPASMRRTMLVLWFDKFTPIRVVLSNDKVGILKPAAKGYVEWDIDTARETPFFQLAEENPEAGVFDFDKLVALVSRLGKTIDKKIEDGKVKDEDVASAKAMSIAISGLRFTRVGTVEDAPIQENTDAPVIEQDLGLKVVNG